MNRILLGAATIVAVPILALATSAALGAWAQIGPGCDLWSDGDWKTCCDIHDVAFQQGGNAGDWFNANWHLFTCVWHFSPINAVLMFGGLMIGSAAVWKFGGVSLFQRVTGKKYGVDPAPADKGTPK